jgi:hypothetical protein
MLSPMDDYLIHQVAETLDHPATSDRNFYDRYYFSAFDITGEAFVALAFGQYPNLNVTDAFANAVVGDSQVIVRASRELNGDRGNTDVGPVSVRVLEGLKRLRIACEPNEWGLSFDLTFEARSPAYQEPRFFRRTGPRVVQDYLRYTQTGRWSGTLTIGERRFDVTPERWWGARDRSWGVRRVGEPEPVGAPVPRATFYWNWAPVQFRDRSLLYTVSEDQDGARWHESVVLLPHDGGAPRHLREVRHRLEFAPGTRIVTGGRVLFSGPDGDAHELALRPLGPVWHMFGGGYGPPWRHGVYQGPLAVEGDHWDLTDAESLRRISGLEETLCAVSLDGETGYGPFEFACFGPYRPYGFS